MKKNKKLYLKIITVYLLILSLILPSCNIMQNTTKEINKTKLFNSKDLPPSGAPPNGPPGGPPSSSILTIKRGEKLTFVPSCGTPENLPPNFATNLKKVRLVTYDTTIKEYDILVDDLSLPITWDLKDTEKRYLDTNSYPISSEYRDINNNLLATSSCQTINIITSDPLTTKFFEVEDFKKLSYYANELQIDDSSANALYDASKMLEMYQAQKQSLIDRGSTDTAKISEVNAKIVEINDNISALQGSVLGELSALYNKSFVLANHVNAITETNYITFENNINDIWGYMDTFSALDQSIESLLSPNLISFFEPDKESLNKTNIAFKWQVKNERVEILDPKNIFDASSEISYEIQLAKQLTTDILANKFDSKYKMSAIIELKTAINQIKNHNQYLKSSSKDFYLKYQERFKKLNLIYTTIISHSILNLSLVIENRALYSDTTYRIKNETLDKILDKSKKIASDVSSTVKEELNRRIIVARSFKGSNIPEKEITTAIMLGIDSASWKLLKQYNQKAVDDLVNAVESLVDISLKLIPGNKLGKINFNDIAKDPIGIFSESTSKQVELALGKKITLPELVEYLFEVSDYVKGLKNLYDKYVLATAPKKVNGNPCYPDGTLAPMPTNNAVDTSRVECVRDLAKISVEQKLNKNLKEYYEGEKDNADAKKRRPANQIFNEIELKKLRDALKDGDNAFKKALREVVINQKGRSRDDIEAPDENDPDKEWKNKIYNEYIEIYKRVVDKNIYDGIPINKIEIKTTEPDEIFYIYTPAFKVHNFSSANTSNLPPYGGRGIVGNLFITTTIDLEGNTTLTGKGTNFGFSDFKQGTLKLIDNLGSVVDYETVDLYIKPAFTWHHDENLDQMILVPRFLHNKMKHWGGASVLERSGSDLRKKWKKSLKYLDVQ